MALFGLIRDKAKTDATALPIMRELPPPVEESSSPPASTPTVENPLLPSADELLQMLFDSIVSNDEPRLAALCNDYHDFITEHASVWLIPPDSLRDHAPAAEWYVQGVRHIIHACTSPAETATLAEFLASISDPK